MGAITAMPKDWRGMPCHYKRSCFDVTEDGTKRLTYQR